MLKIDIQPFIDVIVKDLSKTDLDNKAEKVVVAKFSELLRPVIEYHSDAMAKLLAEPNGKDKHAKLIAWHQSELDYYQS